MLGYTTKILNFGHPLNDAQLHQIEALTGQHVAEVRDIPTHFDSDQPFVPQVKALANACGLSPNEWQTTPLLVNLPALNLIAVTLLAELHGRMGYFPAVLRLRPIFSGNRPQFEVAEVINLQALRDRARAERS